MIWHFLLGLSLIVVLITVVGTSTTLVVVVFAAAAVFPRYTYGSLSLALSTSIQCMLCCCRHCQHMVTLLRSFFIFAYAVYLYWLLFLAKTPLMPHLQLNTAFWLIDFTIFDCHYSYRVCIFYLYKWHFNFCLLVKCETHLSFLLFSKKCRFF